MCACARLYKVMYLSKFSKSDCQALLACVYSEEPFDWAWRRQYLHTHTYTHTHTHTPAGAHACHRQLLSCPRKYFREGTKHPPFLLFTSLSRHTHRLWRKSREGFFRTCPERNLQITSYNVKLNVLFLPSYPSLPFLFRSPSDVPLWPYGPFP